MPRPIITNNPQIKVDGNTNRTGSTTLRSGVASDRDLLKKRSAKYIQRMTALDHGTLTDTKGFAALVEKLQEEFGALGIVEYPLGIVSKCYLGPPYEVHVLDLSGTQIINHYQKGMAMPGPLEKARALAIHNSYAMIEVYANKMILVKEDGSTTKL